MNKNKEKIDSLLFSGIDANIELGLQLNKFEKVYPRLAEFCIKYDNKWTTEDKAATVLQYEGISYEGKISYKDKNNYLVTYFQCRWKSLSCNWGNFSLVHRIIITRFFNNLKWPDYKNHFFNTELNDLLQKKKKGGFKPEVISPIFGNQLPCTKL